MVGVDGEVSMKVLPKMPRPASIVEFAMKAAMGHPSTPKGGSPEYRNGPWYKLVHGRGQGDRMRSAKKKQKFGSGPYADETYCFTTIEMYVSHIRRWYDEQLQDDWMVGNPARNKRLVVRATCFACLFHLCV